VQGAPQSAIFVTDSTGAVIGANRAIEQAAGLQAEQILGGPWGALLDPSAPLGLRQLINSRLERWSYSGAYLQFAGADQPSRWRLLVEVASNGTRVGVAEPAHAERATKQLVSIYSAASAAEAASAQSGATLDTVAGHGAEAIAAGLAGLGFQTYDDFLRSAVPAEVPVARALPAEPPDAALTGVWGSAAGVDRHLERQQASYAKLMEVSALLVGATRDLMAQIEPMEEAARQIMSAARTLSGSATPLTAAHRVRTSVEQAGIRFRALSLGVKRSQELVATQRLLLAIARRVGRAVLATLSQSAELGQRDLGLVVPLVGALHTVAPPLAMGAARVSANLARLAREATEAAGQVRMLDTTLTSWDLLAQRFDLPGSLIPGDLDAKAAAARLDGMRDLARGAIAQPGTDAGAFSEAAAGVARALRYAPGFSFAL
jgi:aerotaxis receptor